MKILKYAGFLIFSVLLFACGDDASDSVALRYVDSQSGLVDFKLYYGSDAGGIENTRVDTLKRKPGAFFASASFESYTSTSISFIGERMSIEQSSIKEIFPYKFEDGSLYVKKSDGFKYYGDGDASVLDIRQHYIGYKTGDGNFKIVQAVPMKEVDKDYAASLSSFVTIGAMTNKEDTLIWVTRKAAFR